MKENCYSSWKGEKPLLSSPPRDKLYLCWRHQKTESANGPPLLLLVKNLWSWAGRLQISTQNGQGCLWQRLTRGHQLVCDGSVNIFYEERTFHILSPPPKRKPDVYLQRAGRGCVSWAGRCCSSWDCCGGRRNFHPAADAALPEQRDQRGR